MNGLTPSRMTDRDVATEMIDRAIEEADGPLPPRFLVKYLLGPWRDRVVRTLEICGTDSPAWQADVELTRLLLWSVAPKRDDGERGALVSAIERLLPAIKAALDGCDWRVPARRLFMHALANHHARLIRGDAEIPRRQAETLIDLTDTIQLDARDPHYRDYLDALNHARLEKITIEPPFDLSIPPGRGPRGTG